MADKGVPIKDKTILVSGANRGIGKAIAEALLEGGAAKVYAGARNTDSLNDLVEKYGDKLVAVELDVTKDETIKSAAETASDIDILINNAGVLIMGNFSSGNFLESLKNNLDVNVFGLVKLTDAFMNNLTSKDSAAIINVASMVGLASMPMGSSYSASKAAVHNLTQGLRGELKDKNVLVSCVYPGPIDTDMTKGFDMDKASPEHVAKKVIAGIEQGAEYIFPDPMSEQMGALYMTNPKKVEEEFSNFA